MNLYPNSKLILQATTHGSLKFWVFYFEPFPNSTNLQEITHIGTGTQTASLFYRLQHMVHWNFDFLYGIYKSTRNHTWFLEILTFSILKPFLILQIYKNSHIYELISKLRGNSTGNNTWFMEILTFYMESTNLQGITHGSLKFWLFLFWSLS